MKQIFKSALYYFEGYVRYYLYFYCPVLIRSHIKKQIDYRLKVMDKDCYNNGSCKICGCSTVELQMCSKACPKPCYPPLLDKIDLMYFEKYKEIKKDGIVYYKNEIDNNELERS